MIKLCGAVCIVAGTTCYGLFYAFQKKSRLWRLKQFKESLLCLSGQLRVARMTMPQALAQIGQKSRYDYLSQFYIFVSENLEQHTYSGFWETWAAGIDSYVRDIYLTESDSEILKNIGSIPLHLDIQMQLAFLEENISELENLIEETQKDIRARCRIYQSAGVIAGLVIVLILIQSIRPIRGWLFGGQPDL